MVPAAYCVSKPLLCSCLVEFVIGRMHMSKLGRSLALFVKWASPKDFPTRDKTIKISFLGLISLYKLCDHNRAHIRNTLFSLCSRSLSLMCSTPYRHKARLWGCWQWSYIQRLDRGRMFGMHLGKTRWLWCLDPKAVYWKMVTDRGMGKVLTVILNEGPAPRIPYVCINSINIPDRKRKTITLSHPK
jgi:hypothetical protein